MDAARVAREVGEAAAPRGLRFLRYSLALELVNHKPERALRIDCTGRTFRITGYVPARWWHLLLAALVAYLAARCPDLAWLIKALGALWR